MSSPPPFLSGGVWDAVQAIGRVFVPGQFYAIARALRETAAVAFGSTFRLTGYVAQLNPAYLDMLDSEFRKLWNQVRTRAGYVSTAYEVSTLDGEWKRWSEVVSAQGRLVTSSGLLVSPEVVWDRLARLAHTLDAIATNEPYTYSAGDVFNRAGELVNDAARGVLRQAEKGLAWATDKALTFAVGAAAVVVGGVVLYRYAKG